ncbi:hypothetical protein ACWCPM_33565 [Streptomyces sp. NPDC002309]
MPRKPRQNTVLTTGPDEAPAGAPDERPARALRAVRVGQEGRD